MTIARIPYGTRRPNWHCLNCGKRLLTDTTSPPLCDDCLIDRKYRADVLELERPKDDDDASPKGE